MNKNQERNIKKIAWKPDFMDNLEEDANASLTKHILHDKAMPGARRELQEKNLKNGSSAPEKFIMLIMNWRTAPIIP